MEAREREEEALKRARVRELAYQVEVWLKTGLLPYIEEGVISPPPTP